MRIAIYDSLTQLVEYNTFNVEVIGSSPMRITFVIGIYIYFVKGYWFKFVRMYNLINSKTINSIDTVRENSINFINGSLAQLNRATDF